jgi:hypothetical protein
MSATWAGVIFYDARSSGGIYELEKASEASKRETAALTT